MTAEETAVVGKLLEAPFQGSRELAAQVAHALVREIAGPGDHCGSIEFKVENDAHAPVAVSVPAEARGVDEDGVEVDFLLHVRDGRLDTLEILKADGTAIKRLPKAKTLVVGLQKQRN
jgi:hypothetical protein